MKGDRETLIMNDKGAIQDESLSKCESFLFSQYRSPELKKEKSKPVDYETEGAQSELLVQDEKADCEELNLGTGSDYKEKSPDQAAEGMSFESDLSMDGSEADSMVSDDE